MAVEDTHPLYDKQLPEVKKVRAAISGEVDNYIIKMPGHTDDDYKRYKERAYYLPAVGRTHETYTGMIMRPAPTITGVDEALQHLLDDASTNGEPFNRLVSRVVSEVMATGRVGVLVDYPDTNQEIGEVITRSQADEIGLRPYASVYTFENIFNWRTEVVNGERVLTQVRLLEYDERRFDEFETDIIERIRVLDLHEGYYRVRIWERVQDKQRGTGWVRIGEDQYPEMSGQKMTYLPIVIFGVNNLSIEEPLKLPLKDLTEINLSHLNDSASLQWALLWVGSPTLFIAGQVPTDPTGAAYPIRLGSSAAIVMAEGSRAEIIQAGADSLGALRQSLEDKRRDMATVGSRSLQDENSSQISTETEEMQRGGEHNVLSQIAESISDGLRIVLNIMIEWAGSEPEDVTVQLNTDYTPKSLSAQELTAWVGAVQGGVMPNELFLSYLKDRGIAPTEMTLEEFEDKIDEDALGQDDSTVFE